MKDMIIRGTGNSRKLKSSLPEGTTWEDALALLRAGTFPIDLNGIDGSGITQTGTALNKQNLMPDALASAIETLTGHQFTEWTPANGMDALTTFLDTMVMTTKAGIPSDLDDATSPAFFTYDLTSQLSHYPEDLTLSGCGALFVLASQTGIGHSVVTQMFLAADGVWFRTKQGADPFDAWKRLYGPSNIATASKNGLMSSTDKSAFDLLTVRGRGTSAASDIGSITEAGTYWLSSAVQTTGWPGEEGSGTKNAILNVYCASSGGRVQELIMYSGLGDNRTYIRMYMNSQWYPWKTVSNEISRRISATGKSTYTITVPSDSAHLLIINSDVNTACCAVIHTSANSNGATSRYEISKGASTTIGGSTNSITITWNSVQPIYIVDIRNYGGWCSVA